MLTIAKRVLVDLAGLCREQSVSFNNLRGERRVTTRMSECVKHGWLRRDATWRCYQSKGQ